MKKNPVENCFAVTAPGLEALCAAELEALGVESVEAVSGGVNFVGDRLAIWRANLWLRTASRVLVRVGEFKCRDFPTLYHKACRLPWGRFLKPDAPLSVQGSCRRSRLIHSDRLAETVQQAVNHALGNVSESRERQSQTVYARVDRDVCTLSVDSSGELLHRRGYRQEQGKAPLRETLAAALLQLAGWRPDQPLWDPFCGSGTLLIEAALWARNLAPGRHRSFAFMDWPKFHPNKWQGLLKEFASETLPVAGLYGSDLDSKMITLASRNAERAGVGDLCLFDVLPCGLRDDLPDGPGLILSNPPYGERLDDEAGVVASFKELREVLEGPCRDWRAALLVPDLKRLRKAGLKGKPLAQLSNGGLNVVLADVTLG